MRPTTALLSVALVVALGAARPVPDELSALAAKARLAPVVAWCSGEFRAGHGGAYAVAVSAGERGGRYLVLEADAQVLELGSFARGPDLACYAPAEARELDRSISRSETISGHIAPQWPTTVICAFVDDTTAVCWQHSPDDQAFVKVGEWAT